MQKRIQLLPTTLKEERLAKSLEESVPDRVYLLKNKNPVGMHKKLNENATENLREIVEEKTVCYDQDEVIERGIEFYEFGDALIEGYEILYEESQKGNEIIVNVSGGTKPVAIALTYACSLVENGRPWYYVGEKYQDGDSQSDGQSEGVLEDKIELGPIVDLDITCILPDRNDTEMIRILTQLLELDDGERATVKDLVANSGKIPHEPPGDEEKQNERNSILRPHYDEAGDLVEDGLADKFDGAYRLTETGELIAKLVKVRENINQELGNAS